MDYIADGVAISQEIYGILIWSIIKTVKVIERVNDLYLDAANIK